MIDCFFSLEGVLATTRRLLKPREHFCRLQGNILTRFKDARGLKVDCTTVLEKGRWEVPKLSKAFAVKLTSRGNGEVIELLWPDITIQEEWFSRLKKLCQEEDHHGIQIQSLRVFESYGQFQNNFRASNGKKLKVSVWDLSGRPPPQTSSQQIASFW